MAEDDRLPVLPRLPTGIAGLDTILNGGLLVGGAYLCFGSYGTGKTILVNQIAFHHAGGGGSVLYLTLLAESHARMLLHIQSMAFFDPAVPGQQIAYISAFPALRDGGLGGLLELIRTELRRTRATLLILDGLETLTMAAESPLAIKTFVYDLQVSAAANNATTLLVSQQEGPQAVPEYALVDGVFALRNVRVGMRSVRELEVRKFRGELYLEGAHFFTISRAGVRVFPRIEALLNSPPPVEAEERSRQALGIERLDAMLQGGLLSGSSTMVYGPTGSGKTLLGLHFLAAGARVGEPGLFLGFYETPPRLVAKAEQIGLEFAAHAERGLITIRWQQPVEQLIDALAEELLAAVAQHQIRRLVIDGLGGFQNAAVAPERTESFFTALGNELRARNVTTVFTVEAPDLVGPTVPTPFGGVSAIAENLLFLRYVELQARLYRLISIIKLRDSDYDPEIREFQITSRGINIAASFAQVMAVLSGSAHPIAPSDPRPGPNAPER